VEFTGPDNFTSQHRKNLLGQGVSGLSREILGLYSKVRPAREAAAHDNQMGSRIASGFFRMRPKATPNRATRGV
jgi:hypothetical protein